MIEAVVLRHRARHLAEVSSTDAASAGMPSVADQVLAAALKLRRTLGRLNFAQPVTHVYNPLDYAWDAHERYVRLYGTGARRVVFLGMNPGPFGMVQTGVPFGEIAMVRDWLQITASVGQPGRVHPKRPILGFACTRSEVSGRRLWGLFAARFKSPQAFFQEHFVLNYCPLAFMESSGRNLTPDKLPLKERTAVMKACDEHLRAVILGLKPEWLIGVGGFACQRALEVFPGGSPRIGQILHPSPACPAANRDWAGTVEQQLRTLSVWR